MVWFIFYSTNYVIIHNIKSVPPDSVYQRFPEIFIYVGKRSNAVENGEKDSKEICRIKQFQLAGSMQNVRCTDSQESSRAWTSEVHQAHNSEREHILKSCALSAQLTSSASPTGR